MNYLCIGGKSDGARVRLNELFPRLVIPEPRQLPVALMSMDTSEPFKKEDIKHENYVPVTIRSEGCDAVFYRHENTPAHIAIQQIIAGYKI